MKKILTIGALLFAAACTTPALAEKSGAYDFTGFDELDIAAGIDVEFTQATEYSVVAEFKRGNGDNIKIRQDGDRLYIARKSSMPWKNDRTKVIVRVSAPSLEAIEASSGSSLTADGVLTPEIEIDVSSGASVDLSGECDTADIRVSSGGSLSAKSFECIYVTAKASSGGNASAYASASVDSNTSSGGSVSIYGNPPERETNNPISGGSTRFR